MTVAEIWEHTQKFNSELFQSMKDGATWEEAEQEYNAKIAAVEHVRADCCYCFTVYLVTDCVGCSRGGWECYFNCLHCYKFF